MVTNDDGIEARGIRELVRAASVHGDVIVVAPNKGYSGQSHSITVMAPLTADRRSDVEGAAEAYAVGGSPVDCIKLGVYALASRRPDLVLSGINHGSNASASVHYSGTLGAAREAAMLGIKSIGFSLCDYEANADFTQTKALAERLIGRILQAEGDAGIYYNVNVPKGAEVKGLKVCRVALGKWYEKPTKFTDPFGRDYYWLDGTYANIDSNGDTDDACLAQGYATISACKLDVTDYDRLRSLETDLADLIK